MYVPTSFREERDETILSFLEQFPFATLVSPTENGIVATHLPLVLDRSRRSLVGHVARANTQWQSMFSGNASLAIFHGPHAYISPLMYDSSPAVPTWNYAAIHVTSTPELIEEPSAVAAAVETVVRRFDHDPSRWRKPEHADFLEKLLSGIVAFEMPLASVEAKFKLGQNRSAADQEKMLASLSAGDDESQNLARFIEAYRQGRSQ